MIAQKRAAPRGGVQVVRVMVREEVREGTRGDSSEESRTLAVPLSSASTAFCVSDFHGELPVNISCIRIPNV